MSNTDTDVLEQLEESFDTSSLGSEVSDELIAILRGDPDAKKDWERVNLKDVMNFSSGKTSPDRDNSGQYNVYGSNGIIGHSDEINTDAGTIIIGRVGSYCGSVYYSDTPCWVTDNALRGNVKNNAHSRYFYYLLVHMNLNKRATGSGQPLLNQSNLGAIEIDLPPLHIQKQIADLLSIFDDKIDLLRTQNKTLEAMAQAIYKHWFVDFEFPMSEEDAQALGKPELAGQPYKSSGGPMKPSELGDIPENWEVSSLTSNIDFLNGIAMQKYPNVPGNPAFPVIKIRELNQGVNNATDWCAVDIPDKYIINTGDILFSWSGSLDVKIWAGPIAGLNQHLFKVSSEIYPAWFVYLTLLRFLREFQEIAANKATTMGHIQRHHLDDTLFAIRTEVFEGGIDQSQLLWYRILENDRSIAIWRKMKSHIIKRLVGGI